MLLLGCVAVTCLITNASANESKDKDKADVGTVIGIDLGTYLIAIEFAINEFLNLIYT